MKHLPERFQCKDVFTYFKCWAALTVRIRVKLSPQRPQDDPLASQGGCSTGTASVISVQLHGMHGQPGNRECPCKQCKRQRVSRPSWACIILNTANHCIYDDFEAENCKADFFYDSKNSLRDGKVVTIYGGKILDSSYFDDLCMLAFPTHDLKLATFLFNMKNSFMNKLFPIHLPETPRLNVSNKEVVVIISHPHGQPKKVTIGELKDYRLQEDSRGEENNVTVNIKTMDLIFFDYTTATCKGSSGAHIICMEDLEEMDVTSVHQKRGASIDRNTGMFVNLSLYLETNRYRVSQRLSDHELSKAYKK